MLQALGPVAALLLSVALLLMGNGLQNTLTPVRADLEAFSPMAIGLLGGGYYAGFTVGCLLGPMIVRRAGHIRAFAAMVSVASAAALVHPLFLDATVWVALRAITGFCFAGLFMIVESWLNEKATNETRGVIFSLYLVINLSVVTVGQLMVTLDDPASYSLFTLASILVSLAAVPLSMTRSAQPEPPQTVRLRLLRLYRLSPVGVVGSFAVGLANGAFWTLGPVYAVSTGGGSDGAAVFMATAAISGAIGQWPLGRASDKMDRRRVIVFACAAGAVASVLMWRLGDDAAARLACTIGFGLFAIPIYALAAAHMNDMVESDGFVEAASGLLLTFSVGAMIGPVIASSAMDAFGPSTLFAYTAVVHLALISFTLYRIRVRVAATEEERGVFAEAILQAQTVAQVEPFETEELAEPEELVEEIEAQAEVEAAQEEEVRNGGARNPDDRPPGQAPPPGSGP